jgi:hypothetical protein
MKTIDIAFSDREYQLFERAAAMTGRPLNEETISWLTICGLELWLALAGVDSKAGEPGPTGEGEPDIIVPIGARRMTISGE